MLMSFFLNATYNCENKLKICNFFKKLLVTSVFADWGQNLTCGNGNGIM